MSLQNALDFARRVASDPTLAARVAAALKDSANSAAAATFSALGREEGFDFSPEEAVQARNQILQSQPMSEGDLDKVAGGGDRDTLASLVASNFLGQNTPAIAANEAQYAEMWAQDANAMSGYLAGASAGNATVKTP